MTFKTYLSLISAVATISGMVIGIVTFLLNMWKNKRDVDNVKHQMLVQDLKDDRDLWKQKCEDLQAELDQLKKECDQNGNHSI